MCAKGDSACLLVYTTERSCDAAGACRDADAICPEIYSPVCGANEVTYSSDCKALAAGQRSYTKGACVDRCKVPESCGNCTLTGGETVQHGWGGPDTGSNSCNRCQCHNGNLGCTKILCSGDDDCNNADLLLANATLQRKCCFKQRKGCKDCKLSGGEMVAHGDGKSVGGLLLCFNAPENKATC